MVSFMNIYLAKAVLCLWMYNNFYPFFLLFFSICLKFVISDLYVVQWSILEFHENRRREGRTLLMDVE